jgi:two-component system OmpR family response regulator
LRILLIDDDSAFTALLAEYLVGDGFACEQADNPAEGLQRALTERFDAVILDVMMPQMDGMAVLRRLRIETAVPVLMLTARGDSIDRIIGLELGADDYVPKPCTPRELTARIRAILRRTNAQPSTDSSSPLTVGALSIWSEQRRATWGDQPLALTSSEFNLLEVLAQNAGKAVSKKILSEQALGRPLARFDRNIDVHLSSIRQKLGAATGGESCIRTVYRQGYQFIKE